MFTKGMRTARRGASGYQHLGESIRAEVRPSALRWKWTLNVQGKTIGCVSLEHGGKLEREKEIGGTPKIPKHQISQSVAGFCFYWSEKRSTGGLEQRGMPQSD